MWSYMVKAQENSTILKWGKTSPSCRRLEQVVSFLSNKTYKLEELLDKLIMRVWKVTHLNNYYSWFMIEWSTLFISLAFYLTGFF